MILPCVDGITDFPKTSRALADPDGLLCFGGDLSTDRLVNAYRSGIFPWYAADEPILWWSPAQRMVLKPSEFYCSKSLKKALRQHNPAYYYNRNFKAVIEYCASVPRADNGTWIHPAMITAYIDLFEAGHAFCMEAEVNGELVGGIYGVNVGSVLCGESMFSLKTNGSKYAMFGLCQHMIKNAKTLLDCQIHNPHLASIGAHLIPRQHFLEQLD